MYKVCTQEDVRSSWPGSTWGFQKVQKVVRMRKTSKDKRNGGGTTLSLACQLYLESSCMAPSFILPSRNHCYKAFKNESRAMGGWNIQGSSAGREGGKSHDSNFLNTMKRHPQSIFMLLLWALYDFIFKSVAWLQDDQISPKHFWNHKNLRIFITIIFVVMMMIWLWTKAAHNIKA